MCVCVSVCASVSKVFRFWSVCMIVFAKNFDRLKYCFLQYEFARNIRTELLP